MSTVKSIKCTNCAAPLDLLGGGRVETITCGYCKSTLDLNNDYKVLGNFKSTKERQKLPFKIGMKGQLKGIDYTIIGCVSYQTKGYPLYEWTDFLLFSPFYGYAYLTYEDGHLIYSKRNRTFPNTPWNKISSYDEFTVNQKAYVPFDKYEATVTYVEGELTWIAKRNDKISFIDLINAPYGISVEKSKQEIEHYENEYLSPSLVYEAFGLETQKKPHGFHALKPFERPFLKSLSLVSYWVLFIIALFVGIMLFDGQGELIKQAVVTNTETKNIEFTVKKTEYLVDLELTSTKAKELDNFQLKIYKENKVYFSLNHNAAYIFNHNTGAIEKKLQAWHKKSTQVRVSLDISEPGRYQLEVQAVDPSLKSKVLIRIKEASSRMNYFGYFFLLTLFFWLIYKYIEWRYHSKIEDERGIGSSFSPIRSLNLLPIIMIGVPLVVLVIFIPELLIPVILIALFVLPNFKVKD